jgi:hypothetical protein
MRAASPSAAAAAAVILVLKFAIIVESRQDEPRVDSWAVLNHAALDCCGMQLAAVTARLNQQYFSLLPDGAQNT